MIKTRLVEPTASAYGFPLLIKTILEQPLKLEPDREIVYRDQVRMTYRDFHKRVAQLAHALDNLGVKPGDVIGVMEFDSHRYLEMYFAIPMVGAVLHTINFRLSPGQIVYTMNHAEDKFVFCNSSLIPLLNEVHSQLETVEKYVVIDHYSEGVEAEFETAGTYEDLISKEKESYDFPDFDENTMATLFYTTGTTGLPKGVCYSHRQLVLHTFGVISAVGSIDSFVNINSSDNYMPLTPMFHVHAWGIPYVATMLAIKQVYPGPYEPEMLMKLILTEKITFSHCVPTILGFLLNGAEAHDLKFDNIKVLIGGSAFPEGLARRALERGINATTGYGLSETCPVLTLPYMNKEVLNDLKLEDQVKERIKTGRPIFFVDLRIMDDDGNFLPHDGKSVGEIVVRAPWLTQRYYKEEQRSEELWEFGWQHTGDMAVVEPNGTVVIVDRKKDVIKSGGEWISSLELESLISGHSTVKQTAIVGMPDEKWGERPVALIVLKEDKNPDIEGIKEYLSQYVETGEISKWAVPDEYKFVEDIPKTSVGKIDKKRIREMLTNKEL